ncbi:MAG: metallophosphoesterase family protein [Verrucomicrobiales bacterium]|nr:metallophosphoesterase family protein [Verrucomicrobiales bacterium]
MLPGSASTVCSSLVSRRHVLRRLTLAPALLPALRATAQPPQPSGRLRFGLIADIHPDMLPDGRDRVRAFVATMQAARVDFILQLGDFCWPAPSNRRYLEAWNEYRGPAYHVLGNHDMDEGYTREQTVAYCGMPGMHYTFEAGPIRGLVLDGNEPGGKASGYRRFMGPEQLAWLEGELKRADRPVMLFIHQPIDADLPDYLENSASVRAVLEQAESQRPGTVLAVFSGHLHMDYERVVKGIRYVQVNSAAYWWLNNPAARRETYPSEVHQKYRYLTHVAAYRDPLWALVTVDLDRRELQIEGRRTEWIGPDPWTRGETTDRPHEHIRPQISDRRMKVG